MAHSLTPTPIISTGARKKTPSPLLGFQRNWSRHQAPNNQASNDITVGRRMLMWGLGGAVVVGLNVVGDQSASAAKRKPPSSPPEERKDPNVSGVQAKVLASIKRKEAMKESMAKLRERGKPVINSSE